MTVRHLEKKAKSIRKKILSMALAAGSGHIGAAFSCVEILVALYHGGVLRVKPSHPRYRKRDRFVLSKGHAAIALYAVLADRGFFPPAALKKFAKNKSCLGLHPQTLTPGVDVLSGSLGHGVSVGSGFALGAKLNGDRYATVVLLGDGECQEGMIWEAANFASAHRLNNLTAIIDCNGLSATTFLREGFSPQELRKKWEAFGWQCVVVRGHSFEELLSVLRMTHDRSRCKPLAVIAMTTKGNGISFMENNPIWHYRVPFGSELKAAAKEINGTSCLVSNVNRR